MRRRIFGLGSETEWEIETKHSFVDKTGDKIHVTGIKLPVTFLTLRQQRSARKIR
jgi:hypothetical protein